MKKVDGEPFPVLAIRLFGQNGLPTRRKEPDTRIGVLMRAFDHIHAKGITMKQTGHSPRRIVILLILLPALAILLFAAAGCGEQMARMEDNQVKLQAMVAANARQLATISSQIHANNGDVQDGIRKLDENDQSLTADVATVQDKQAQLHKTVTSGDEALSRRMASLEENQALLRDGVAEVAGITQRTASNVTAIAKEHATLHRMVQSSKQELAQNIATVANNQKTIQTGIGHLQQTEQQMTEQLVTLADGQQTLRTAIRDDNAQLTGQLTSLATRHDELHNRVGKLDELANGVMHRTNDLAEGQTRLQTAMQSRTQSLAERIVLVTRNQENLQALVDRVANTATKTAGDVTALAAGQADVRKALDSNHKIVSGQMAAAIENQQNIQTSIGGLHQKANQTAASLGDLTQGQDTLHAKIETHDKTVDGALTNVSQNQTNLQQGLANLHEQAEILHTDVITMGASQDALRQAVQKQGETVAGRMDNLASNQNALGDHLDTVTVTTGQMALDLMAMDKRQVEQHRAVCGNLAGLDAKTSGVAAEQATLCKSVTAAQSELGAQLTGLAEAQQGIQGRIGALDTKTNQVRSDVTTVVASQDSLHQAVQRYDGAVRDQMKKLADNQQAMQSGLDTMAATANQAALSAASVSEGQARLEKAVRAGIDSLDEKTNHLASNLDALATGQASLQESLQRHDESVSEQMAGVTGNQQQIRNSLDTAVATAGQTALDVLAVASEQEALQRDLRSHTGAVNEQMTDLAKTHTAMQANLDTVTATTGQLALDLIDVGDKQTALTQVVQANQTKLAAELAQVAQDRQQWNERLGAAQTEMETLAGSISMLDERLTKLHGTLQTNLDGMSALIDARGRERAELTAQLKEELQAVIETVNQLRQTQTSLQSQMQQMHEATQGQGDDILSAIEQLQREPSEVRVSNAGTEAKSALAETGE
jgi:chromosome segregation ATPase